MISFRYEFVEALSHVSFISVLSPFWLKPDRRTRDSNFPTRPHLEKLRFVLIEKLDLGSSQSVDWPAQGPFGCRLCSTESLPQSAVTQKCLCTHMHICVCLDGRVGLVTCIGTVCWNKQLFGVVTNHRCMFSGWVGGCIPKSLSHWPWFFTSAKNTKLGASLSCIGMRRRTSNPVRSIDCRTFGVQCESNSRVLESL